MSDDLSKSVREFAIDAETKQAMDALKERFGVSTNAEVLKRALAESRAALSVPPIPQGSDDGLPRGSASGAEPEPVAWRYWKANPLQFVATLGAGEWRYLTPAQHEDYGKDIPGIEPLYTAETLAAAEARADRAERDRKIAYDMLETAGGIQVKQAAEIAELRARADRAAEDERNKLLERDQT